MASAELARKKLRDHFDKKKKIIKIVPRYYFDAIKFQLCFILPGNTRNAYNFFRDNKQNARIFMYFL